MSKVLDKMLAYLIIIVMFAVVAVVPAIPVWLLWNWLMPTIFGVTKITIIQSWGISWLCSMLFGGSSNND